MCNITIRFFWPLTRLIFPGKINYLQSFPETIFLSMISFVRHQNYETQQIFVGKTKIKNTTMKLFFHKMNILDEPSFAIFDYQKKFIFIWKGLKVHNLQWMQCHKKFVTTNRYYKISSQSRTNQLEKSVKGKSFQKKWQLDC